MSKFHNLRRRTREDEGEIDPKTYGAEETVWMGNTQSYTVD